MDIIVKKNIAEIGSVGKRINKQKKRNTDSLLLQPEWSHCIAKMEHFMNILLLRTFILLLNFRRID